MGLPNHIAIILDGNGRWAKSKGMPRSYGHVKGCANLETICDEMKQMGIKYLTVYAFSTENWKRSKEEIDGLMRLFRNYLKKCIKISDRNKMQIRVIGDTAAFDEDIQEKIKIAQEHSAKYSDLHFQLALNYGGRDEIKRAVERMLKDQKEGLLSGEISEETISSYLDTAGLPDPDLLIRTSGEQRLSNFLPWQLAYTEFYFTEVPWPDFNHEELVKAIKKYEERDRRFGGVKEESHV
ncbi:MAG TPA: isoprenyl transferase [Lachnospiraceae bacterium]